MFYYRCKYVLDFYIVLFLSMLSQAVCLIKFLIFCTNSSSLFFSSLFTPPLRTIDSISRGQKPTQTLIINRRFQSQTCPDSCCYLAEIDGRLTKLFIGGSGLILRPAQPPFLCHSPLEGRIPNQRLRPALPMTCLLWSTLDTRPTVTMHVSITCWSVCRHGNTLVRGEHDFNNEGGV